ncbi:unnamed protein product [Brassicogethes aeneus]|uniref:SHSP domain-containing protein n=1 Tax=Brassicogethes aeneus TaxID=1431903 RepID=A0A9P0AT57_BRAAE|nr:unnamed protein product [Brassicogethes aeneus]
MSLFPLVFRDIMRPLRMMENQMRFADEIFHPVYRMNCPRISVDYEENSANKNEKFQVKLDVADFKPEEITVKTIDGNSIQIEAKHDEKEDGHGFVSRQFVRRFVLPNGHDMKAVVSSLSSDGVLTVTAPRKIEEVKEKQIPITHVESEKIIENNKGKDE